MYNQKVLDIFKNPINAGGLQGANGVAKVTDATFGDIVRIYLKIDDNTKIIENAKFKAMGGVTTIVVANVLCDLIKGKSIDEINTITSEDILQVISQLPEQKMCLVSTLLEALSSAVADYYKRKEREENNQSKK